MFLNIYHINIYMQQSFFDTKIKKMTAILQKNDCYSVEKQMKMTFLANRGTLFILYLYLFKYYIYNK